LEKRQFPESEQETQYPGYNEQQSDRVHIGTVVEVDVEVLVVDVDDVEVVDVVVPFAVVEVDVEVLVVDVDDVEVEEGAQFFNVINTYSCTSSLY
jgi:hypothetical protein